MKKQREMTIGELKNLIREATMKPAVDPVRLQAFVEKMPKGVDFDRAVNIVLRNWEDPDMEAITGIKPPPKGVGLKPWTDALRPILEPMLVHAQGSTKKPSGTPIPPGQGYVTVSKHYAFALDDYCDDPSLGADFGITVQRMPKGNFRVSAADPSNLESFVEESITNDDPESTDRIMSTYKDG